MKKNVLKIGKAFISITALIFIPLSHADERPLWEIGAGVGALSLPDYRGSDESRVYVLPVPYFVYRGEHLKADRNGIRSMLYDSDKVEINLSINGTIPVHSQDNAARRGMADLKPSLEVGPIAIFDLWEASNKKMRLQLRTPLRTSITVESSPKDIGWVFSPGLNLDVRDPAGMAGWNLGLAGGPIYNDRKYNDHFYSVNASDVTATRPLYSAKGGYSGSQLTMALSKRFARYWVGGFVRYDTLAGAVFKDSPLVKQRSATSAGLAIAWVFNESGKLVTVDPED